MSTLPERPGEVEDGAAVLVAFTVNVYTDKGENSMLRERASLNLQAVTLLARPVYIDSGPDETVDLSKTHPGVESDVEPEEDPAEDQPHGEEGEISEEELV